METMEMTTAAAAAGKPGNKLTKLGWIPEEWDITTLADIVDLERNITYGIVQAGPHVEDGVPYIKTGDLSAEIKPDTLSRTSYEIAQQYSRSEVYPGDIVFSLRGDVGASRIVPADLPVANLTQGTARIAVSGDSDRDFIFQQICSPDVAKRLLDQAKGSTFQEITLKALRLFTIVWPPERERIAIAEVLTSFDKATGNLSKLLIAKRTYKRGLMQQLLTGQRRFPEFQEQPWREFRLGEVFKDFSQLNRNNEDLPILSCSKVYGIVLQETLFGRRIASADIRRYKVVTGGDLVYDPMLLWDASLGFVASVPRGVISPAYVTLRYTGDAETKALLEQALYSEELRFQYKLISRGTNVRRQKAPAEDFLKIKLNLPTSSVERGKIAAVLTACDQEIELLQAQLRQWQQQKKGLMQQLLTGQLRVPH